MLRKSGILWVLSLAVVVCARSYSAEPAASKQQYDLIVANLDTGGDLLVVANAEGCVQSLGSNITQFATALSQTSPDSRDVQSSLAKIPGFLSKNGFYAVRGFGMSVLPRSDGLNTVKVFCSRDPAAMDLPLWRALVGAKPQNLACAGFLPADTVLARTGTGEWPALWAMVRSGIAEFAGPEGKAGFDRQLSNLATNMGVDLDKLVKSLGTEGFCSIQLSRDATIGIPAGPGDPIQMPSPSLLIGLAVKNDTLTKAIEQPLARAQIPVVKTWAEATEVSTINLPMPMPFPFEPSFAVFSNMFLFGSTPAVVADAIKAFKSNTGLIATAEYKKAFQGLPTVNNGAFYMSPRFSKAIVDLQTATMNATGVGGEDSSTLVRDMLGARGDMQSAFVIQNLPAGVLTTGTSSSSGKELVGSALVAPAGLLAAIAIPSFVKARSTAQHNSCINNLRMIDAAKEQWALAERKNEGDPADIPSISEYLKGGTLPVCPQGGDYKVNPIGTNPECSLPGHRLP